MSIIEDSKTKGDLLNQVITTSCEFCCFATYNEDGSPKGCKLGKIEEYKKHGIQVEVKSSKTRDVSWFELVGKYCAYSRSTEWAKDNSDKNLEQLVLDEVKFAYDAVILVKKPDELLRTLKSLAAQKLKPQSFVIVLLDGVSFNDVLPLFTNYQYEGIPVHLNKCMNGKPLDNVEGRLRSGWFTVVEQGAIFPENYFEKLGDMILHGPNRYLYVGHANGFTAQRFAYLYLLGSRPVTYGDGAGNERDLETYREKLEVIDPKRVCDGLD